MNQHRCTNCPFECVSDASYERCPVCGGVLALTDRQNVRDLLREDEDRDIAQSEHRAEFGRGL